MVGDPALPIIAGAYAFGVRGFDTRAALSAMTRAASTAVPGPYFYPSLNQDNPVDASGRPVDAYVERPALADYLRLGYVPYDHGSGFLWGPAATTLEYALADFSLARFASSIGAGAAAEPFARRAQSWRSLLDPSTGYVEPRLTDGGFVTDSSHTSTDGFVEGNSSQYTWLVPQNVAGLATAIGGDAAAAARLDRLFARFGRSATSPNAWLGNAPSLGTPWLYLWLGRPWRTQAVVAAVRSRLFGAYPGGLPGDDDLGTTSAWYVWSALGLYPAIPGVGGLAVGSPLFPHARVRTALGTLDVAASGEGPYVRGLALDGRPSARTWIDVARLRGAHELRFELRPRPQRWGAGTSARPPSFG
jgi:predicted alpha-1,2-mannosidase